MAGSNSQGRTAARLLPTGGPAVRPYVLTQLLADLGSSPSGLSERTVRRIRRSFPVPEEQKVLWADVEFGTRPHGLVLTDAGVVIKDGLPYDADDDDEDVDAASDGEPLGRGYSYMRWENFDAARVSHRDGAPTLDGELFLDGEPFRDFAMACVRINNRRVRMRNAGRKLARAAGILGPHGAVRSVCRASAAATVSFCLSEDVYKFYDDEGDPVPIEVPADQYDAALQRMRKRIAQGCVPDVDDPDMAGVLVRCGWYTRAQAVNLAKTGRVPHVMYRAETGSVICRDPEGLGYWLKQWLRQRSALGQKLLEAGDERMAATKSQVSQALAEGAQAEVEATATKEQAAGRRIGSLIAGNAASQASYTVGATGARVLLSAVGVASGPLALVASLALGQACGKAGTEAISMVKDLFVEPKERVYERLFGGVLANVAFENVLTPAEQALLAELMVRIKPAELERLGAAVASSGNQEAHIRAFLAPLVAAIRRV